MSISSQVAARCCRQIVRPSAASLRLSSSTYLSQRTRRWQSTEAEAASPVNPKISQIVDQISTLTLLETADLVATLKSRLNIPDLPVGGFAMAGGAAPAAAPAEEEEAAPAAQEKTLFNLKLESIDPASKAKVIKEIKSLLGLSLVDSKKFVESVPKVLKESVPKEDAEKIIETLKAVGAKAIMEPLRKCPRLLPRLPYHNAHNHQTTTTTTTAPRIHQFHTTPHANAARSPSVRRAEAAQKRPQQPRVANTYTEDGLLKTPAQGDLAQRLRFLDTASKTLHQEARRYGGVTVDHDTFVRIAKGLFNTAYAHPPAAQLVLRISDDVDEVFRIGYHIGTSDMGFKEWVLAACSLAGGRVPVLYQTARYLTITERRGTEVRQTAVIDRLEEIGRTSNDPRALQLLAQVQGRRGKYTQALELMEAVLARIHPSKNAPRGAEQSYLISEVMETPWRVYAWLKERTGEPMGADEVVRSAALEYEDPRALQDHASLLMREMDLEGYEEGMSKAASSGDAMACLKLANFYYLTSKGWFPRRGVKVSEGDDAKAIPRATRTVDPAKPVEEKKPGALGRFFSFLSADVKSHAEYRKLAVDWYNLADGNYETAWELFWSSRTADAKEFMPTSQDELLKVWRDEKFRPEVPLQLLDL
ncbi:putative mitochondrial 54S ribosomal protein MNP1 [Aspergillus bombycis]|uniref:Putative mitochondrial 54S ribosomal protein MNP1 n=1 Tax=Aspergillus bombycis TaxID=109264 RepID=A0A1F7ZML8_9EURO|nr:putative mitochondrial 54S ribosomal protein MNP1 [Aspergillus bombycis]OGM40706.1 putative mitochondrial 54S ribosomal protein MNP1 [Aspergillus bombycis]